MIDLNDCKKKVCDRDVIRIVRSRIVQLLSESTNILNADILIMYSARKRADVMRFTSASTVSVAAILFADVRVMAVNRSTMSISSVV